MKLHHISLMKKAVIPVLILFCAAALWPQLPKPGGGSGGGGASGAPTDAKYVTLQAESGLSAEGSLGALADNAVAAVDVAGAVATLRAALFSDLVPLWASGSCSGFLKSDGTCSTPASGHATTYDTYANLPATCATGDRHFTSDSIYEFLCTATNTWTAFHQGTKVTIPPSASWAWVNQNTATVSAAGGTQYITATDSGGDSNNCRVRSISVPYTLTAVVRTSVPPPGSSLSAGIALRESGSGELIVFANFNQGGAYNIRVTTWNSPTSFAALLDSTGISIGQDLFYLRVVNNSTNRIFYASFDRGINWEELFSHASGTFLTEDQAGFCVLPWGSQTRNSLVSWDVQ